MARKKKNTQIKIIEEVTKQLLVQTERLGTRDNYPPLWFVEQEALALGKVLSEFYAERANLEYEMNMLGTDKREVLIKLERLHVYIRKAEAMRTKRHDKFTNMIDKEYHLTENERKLRCLDKTMHKAVA